MDSTVNQASLGDDSGIGSRLRRAREDSGRSIQEIADELPLRPKILEALENDDFENLPAPIFVRGYLRTYARLLDISPDPLLEAYERYRFPPPKLETSTPLSQSILPSETLFRTLTHVGLAGLIVLILLWWQYRSPDGFDLSLSDSGSAETIDSETQSGSDIPDDFTSSLSKTPSASNAIEQSLDIEGEDSSDKSDKIDGLALQEPAETAAASAATDPIPEIAAEPDGSESASTSEDDEASEEQDEAAAASEDAEEIPAAATAATAGDSADASAPQGEASQPSPATPAGPSRITIRLRHESWIEVYDRKGERLMFELADADREISLVGDSPFDVLLGNAKDVEVEYNGTPFDYGPHTLNGIARFRLED